MRDLLNPAWVGELPDVVVPGTSLTDWQAVLDLVVGSGWRWEYSVDGEVVSLPPDLLASAHAALRVRPAPDLEVIFRPASVDEIDFDVDLRALQSQAGIDVLCGFLATIGRRLGKPVLMFAEGGAGPPLLRFDPAADRVIPGG